MDVQTLTPIEATASALDLVLGLMARPHTAMEIRAGIDAVKLALEAMPTNAPFLSDYADRLLTHHFADGLYGREAILEKGTIGVTGIHEEQNISVMVKGKLAVITENGCQILEGPKVFTTPSWTRRLIFVMEDSVFVTVHPNPLNDRDTGMLVARITAKNFDRQFDSVSSICGGDA